MTPPGPEGFEQPTTAGSESENAPPAGRRFPQVDRAIVEGVRRADPEAMGAFFDAYFDRIFGLAYRLLGNRTLAEDATQEACYRIQRGAHRLDPERDPAPWVLATTVNTCRSVQRSAEHRRSRVTSSIEELQEESAAMAEPSRGPEELLLAREREALVHRALQKLDHGLREVVTLHEYQGLDHKEIASVLGLSHEAVRKRFSRALAELGHLLHGVNE